MSEPTNNKFFIPKNYRRDIQILGLPIRNIAEGASISLALTGGTALLPISDMVLRTTILTLVFIASFFLLSRGINKDSPTQFLIALVKFLIQRRKLIFRRDFRGK